MPRTYTARTHNVRCTHRHTLHIWFNVHIHNALQVAHMSRNKMLTNANESVSLMRKQEINHNTAGCFHFW